MWQRYATHSHYYVEPLLIDHRGDLVLVMQVDEEMPDFTEEDRIQAVQDPEAGLARLREVRQQGQGVEGSRGREGRALCPKINN